jgi:twinkle protein
VSEESEVIGKAPCPDCGSADNLALYSDGHGFCFTPSCGYKKATGDATHTRTRKPMSKELIQGEYEPLIKRKITIETCQKFGYMVGYDRNDQRVQIASYYDGNEVVAQKLRYADKQFKFIGEPKRAGLFGQQLWGQGGKMVVITEGEIDCLTVSQLQGNKWPVVSIANGASSAKKAISQHIEWLESFESVILMFDMDEAGKYAVDECAPLFSPGKCKIAHLPFKDANECLVQGRGEAVISAIWQAKTYRPDGLVTLEDIMDEVEKPVQMGFPWFLDVLTKHTYGRRVGEIYGLGAGTGVGKTDFLTQQIAFDVTELDLSVGCIFLEQKPVETAKRVAGKVAGKRFHVPDGSWNMEELKNSLGKLHNKITFYDNFGSTDWEVVAAKIRYMAVSQGITVFYLDHLTAMADTADEKGSLEQIMKEMAGLANELQIIITFVSHLTTPEGKPHEEGGRVTIRHFKGSRAIGFWSFFMFGLERNQQAESEEDRQTTTFRVLKDRYTGQATGLTISLGYDRETGRMFEKDSHINPLTSGPASVADVAEMF